MNVNVCVVAQVMECGARRCPPLSFCHEATNSCKQCADICHVERRGHYDPGLCLEQCRGEAVRPERRHARCHGDRRDATEPQSQEEGGRERASGAPRVGLQRGGGGASA